MVVTALRALPPALMVAALASLFSADKDILSVALTAVLYSVAAWLFTAKLLGMLCEQDGVARKHFQWNAQLCDRLMRETQWFLRWLLPGLAVAAVLYRLHGTAPLMGRLAMLAITLWIAIHIARAHPRSKGQRQGNTVDLQWPLSTHPGALFLCRVYRRCVRIALVSDFRN